MPMRKSPRHRSQVLLGGGPKTVPQRIQVGVFARGAEGRRFESYRAGYTRNSQDTLDETQFENPLFGRPAVVVDR